MLTKLDIVNAMEDLHEGDIEEALSVLGFILENGKFIDDMCDCDIDAKDNGELCTCGEAQFLVGLEEDSIY